MRKTKVLHVTQATSGGTLEYLKLLVPRLDSDRFEAWVACPSDGPMRQRLESCGVRVDIVEMCREISPVSDTRSFIELTKLIRRSQPALVHAHSSKAGVIARIAAKTCGVPCVYTPHGWSFGMEVSKAKRRAYALIERLAAPLTDVIVNISAAEQALANAFGVSAARMLAIPNGIDPEVYGVSRNSSVARTLGLPTDAYVIGMVARLAPQKAPLVFVEMARAVADILPNSYFVLVGSGELQSIVEARVADYGLNDRVRLTGWTNDVAQYVALFDVAVLTSAWEGFGLAVIEYMAADKPVVASAVGGIQDIIDDQVNGILVPSGDAQAFARAVIALHGDPGLARQLSNAARETVRTKFHIDRVVRAHEHLYGSLTEAR